MGKTHMDNHQAKLKRGPEAFAKRLREGRGGIITLAPWNVTFTCKAVEYVLMAGSDDIREVVTRQHKAGKCRLEGC